jgi:hypothetical protein
MGMGLPDEFPFNRSKDVTPQPSAVQWSEQPAPQVVEAVAELPLAPAPTHAPPVSPFSQAAVRATDMINAPAPLPTPKPSGMERRRAVRQTMIARAVIRPETNYAGIGNMAAGYLSNISMKGVGFHTRRPLVVGERYSIKLELGPMRWQSRMRVVTCNPHPSGTYDVGAEFVANELQVRVPRDMAA